MCMGKQMILTVFIISVTLRTEAEFQFRIRLIRSSANGTFMPGDSTALLRFMAWLLLHGLLTDNFNRSPAHLLAAGKEKYHKIKKGCGNHEADTEVIVKQGRARSITDNELVNQHCPVNNAKELHLDRQNEE